MNGGAKSCRIRWAEYTRHAKFIDDGKINI